MTRIVALWLPNWPVQRLLRTRPELEQQPVLLYHSGRRGQSVAACSRAAWRRGIRPGMTLSEAAALARAHREPFDPTADREALEKLADWCHRFSPRVGLEEAPPPETLLLDVTGVAPLFGGEAGLLQEIASAFGRLRLSVRHGLADTIGAAWAWAHYGTPEAASSLTELPCAALRLPAEMVATLSRLGLYRIADLLPLPRAELQARFGPLLLQRLDQALGQAGELLVPVRLPPEFSVAQSFEHPVEQREVLAAVLRQLVQRLCFLLRERGVGALGLQSRFHGAAASLESGLFRPTQREPGGPPAHPAAASFELGLFRPSLDAEHLWKLWEVQLERLTLSEPVTGISLTVTRHARLQPRQGELFDQRHEDQNAAEWAAFIDRLTSRLGRQAVLGAVLRSDPQPEKAYRLIPLVGGASCQPSRTAASIPPASSLDRPLRVLRDPLPLDVKSQGSGRELSGPPSRFGCWGRPHELVRCWGPERIETGWWRNRGIRRDYYRVETAAGARFWLFQNLWTGRWFLHGVF